MEVEPAENIRKRFVTGASYGSISREAHEAMAIAMNLIGWRTKQYRWRWRRSWTLQKREDGLSTRSAIKQVASGRFGVTAEYLVNADEIQD